MPHFVHFLCHCEVFYTTFFPQTQAQCGLRVFRNILGSSLAGQKKTIKKGGYVVNLATLLSSDTNNKSRRIIGGFYFQINFPIAIGIKFSN